MLVNFSHEEIDLPKATVLGVAEETSASIVAELNNEVKTNSEYSRKFKCGVKTVIEDSIFAQYLQDNLGHLTHKERSVMEHVLRKYRHIFHVEGSNDFKGTDLVEHRIITGDAKPIRKAPYRVPFALKKEMEYQFQDMLNKRVIEESNSPWNSPAILVRKKSLDGKPKYRVCVDFRAMNAVMHIDTYPLPLIEQATSALLGRKYFSTIDMYSGFWQVKLATEDKMKTAFSTPSGHYHFQRLPYGLSNSPSNFQILMDVVLRNLTGELCFVFTDDILVF
jgi:hypothetical protein